MVDISIPTDFAYYFPVKRINSSKDLQLFHKSIAQRDLEESLFRIIQLVQFKSTPKGTIEKLQHEQSIPTSLGLDNSCLSSLTTDQPENQLQQIYQSKPYIKSIVTILNELSQIIDETPPLEGPRRFGNFSRRTWQEKIDLRIDSILSKHLIPYYKLPNSSGFILEIKWYLLHSFGSKERLDYGTGHELNFLAFLTSLWKVNILPNPQIENSDAIDGYDFLVLFGTYYNVVKKLILSYTLEPAGSHGVWGLDDHFHILYIIGASQLTNPDTIVTNKRHIIEDTISPKLILNRSYILNNFDSNLFFTGIEFIYKVKPKGTFYEHSPILFDISNMKNWSKISKGLIKMFNAEVIGKFPVVQHFWFGGVLLPWKDLSGNDLPVSYEPSVVEEDTKSLPIATKVTWAHKKPLEIPRRYIRNSTNK
ncbi:hypothetical protein WICMUC_002845 [Wickerhamomyces mucosus]|uniref:Serine/threonine-protein phosphatase 2A activator n=1 Tax=Wickerhamomyces mucosus TaxID=1378264 RepID=A0A9P8PMH0_9ASCO|nr:hypothetical protein WICMUC_002845 [Wickerhamomyces mucosus]